MRIGIVGERAELAMQVAAVLAAAGSPEPPVLLSPAQAQGHPGCDVLVVDPVTCAAPPDGWDGSDGCPVVVAHLPGEEPVARTAAIRWAAGSLVELPRAGHWLARLAGSTGAGRAPSALVVLGATGGAGASTLAVAVALAVGGAEGDCLLVDADPWSTGLDLGLGVPDGQGARWADVPTDTGALVADTLRACLPRVGGTYLLTGDPRDAAEPRVTAAVHAGRTDFAHVVVDAGRGPRGSTGLGAVTSPCGLTEGGTPTGGSIATGVAAGLGGLTRGGLTVAGSCAVADRFVVVAPCTLAGVVGARRALSWLPAERTALALRPTDWMPSAEVARVLGCPRVVSVPRLRAAPERAECGELAVGRVGRALAALGADVWAVLR